MSLTDEWLECFEIDLKEGKELSSSIFWRLALVELPEGINPNDLRVKAALLKIKESIEPTTSM